MTDQSVIVNRAEPDDHLGKRGRDVLGNGPFPFNYKVNGPFCFLIVVPFGSDGNYWVLRRSYRRG
jgi:hypothetical protein